MSQMMLDKNGAELVVGGPVLAQYRTKQGPDFTTYKGVLIGVNSRGWAIMREDHTEHLRTFPLELVEYDWNPDPKGLHAQRVARLTGGKQWK